MGLGKLILTIGVAAFVMQSTNSAAIGGQKNVCLCTREYSPVCGSDQITYSNKCLFECAKEQDTDLSILFYGQCNEIHNLPVEEAPIEIHNLPADEEVDACFCTLIYDPVCGSDGQTYSSECEINCAKKYNRNLEVFSIGECVEVRNLPAEKTVMKVENLPANDGAIEVHNLPADEEINACFCTLIYDPVCGSDGQTYSSECEINCAKKFNRNLEVHSTGECIEIQNLPAAQFPEVHNLPADEEVDACFCTLNYDPVCGSDAVTYSNECEIDCAKKFNRNLEVHSKGECMQIQNLPAEEGTIEIQNLPANEEADICLCTLNYDPVCGSDAVTYSNECEIDCAKKFNRNLEVHSKGECIQVQNLPAADSPNEVHNLPADDEADACLCTLIYDPLCGSDGQTYSSDCEFNCAKKYNRNLEVFSKGECIKVEQF